MKIFMLGWEFPPFISGGLGTACFGLTKAMSKLGLEVLFALPESVKDAISTHVKMLTPREAGSCEISEISLEIAGLENVRFCGIESARLEPYSRPDIYQQHIEETIRQKQQGVNCDMESILASQGLAQPGQYASDMFCEVQRYAVSAAGLAMAEDFDIIHAHDWMTYPAGIAIAALTAKPLVVHVHSTEFDRSGENVNQHIYNIERMGMHTADRIIAVSDFTRNIITARYSIPADKVEVVHNGAEQNNNGSSILKNIGIENDEKIVLFLGRITMQKGPEYFLQAARKVLEVMDNVRFVMAGGGDMTHGMIEMAAQMGIGGKVMFTGFLRGEEVDRIYEMADLYVMPSVSEPFGIAPLEAINHDVPVLISKQSGVSEVLTHVLKVDFWDIEEMANKIVAVLKFPPLRKTLREYGNVEARKLNWETSAKKCMAVYERALARSGAC